MHDGRDGGAGNLGNVQSVTCRRAGSLVGSNPTLTAKQIQQLVDRIVRSVFAKAIRDFRIPSRDDRSRLNSSVFPSFRWSSSRRRDLFVAKRRCATMVVDEHFIDRCGAARC